MKTRSLPLWLALILLTLAAAGCSSGTSSFVRDDVDYSFVRRVAVVPFRNLSQDLHAGTRLYSVFMTQLLERDAVEVVAMGEVLGAMNRLRLVADEELTQEQIVALGKELGAQALFFGTVDEYGLERVSNQRIYMVTATFRMAETETGSMVWQAQVHQDGDSLARKLFGGGSASQHAVSKEAVDDALGTLF